LGLSTIVGQHDRRLTDADINLIQDVQDLKRLSIMNHQANSGCLTLSPFKFNAYIEQTFYVPAFNVLFRGEVVRVAGNLSSDLTVNKVVLPPPPSWAPGNISDDATLYVVFLEMWGRSLDPRTGEGYYTDADGARFFYPGGCVTPDPSQLTSYPDNVIDPFQQDLTTLRVQLQWRLRVEPLTLAYNFEKNRYGLDADTTAGAQLYGRGAIPTGDPASDFAFTGLTGLTGEPTLWRAGNGTANNSLQSIDGYSYAMPVAVVFQRNKGVFTVDTNPFGCASPNVQRSGVFSSGVSGRLDGRFADIVYTEDVVDTRLSVSLTGYELDELANQGIADVFTGANTYKIARGEAPGTKATALGSKLPYTVAMAPATARNLNVDTVGSWDGFANGFSSDARVFYTTKLLNLSDRTVVGLDPTTQAPNTNAWGQGDVVPISLDANTQAAVTQGAAIAYVFVQSLTSMADGSKLPIALYGGQLLVEGLNNRQVTIRITSNLQKSTQAPGANPLIVTLGLKYPAGDGAHTKKVPVEIAGGELFDAANSTTFPVFGVSEYDVAAQKSPQTFGLKAIDIYSPFYSSSIFGLRVRKVLANTSAVVSTGDQQTQLNTFTIPRKGMDGRFFGLYVVTALDAGGNQLHISRREVIGDNILVVVDGQLSATSSTEFTILCHRTAHAAINPPVRGVTAIEEVVLFGNAVTSDIANDPRMVIASVKYGGVDTTIVAYAKDAKLKGFAGDDTQPLIWVRDAAGKFVARPCTVDMFGGLATITIPNTNLETSSWFMTVSLLPSFSPASKFLLTLTYVPYQGEGVEGRNYTVIHAGQEALITTNGTGAAPVVGLQDVFPFNRQFPISPTMPALADWSDAELKNQALGSEFDSNFIAKRFNNIEHTLGTRLHTNDFITPLHGYIRRKIQLSTKAGRRGFAKATPHIGFAIPAPKPRSVLGDNLQTTVSPITLYVNNVGGNDANDGLTKTTAKLSIKAALASLPPVLRHPVAVILIDTSYAYTIKNLSKSDFTQALLGDGETRQIRYYCLGEFAFVMQEAARITIGRETSTGERIIIDATGFTGFGDGPTYAFFAADSRVILHGIAFKGFTGGAVKAIDSDVEFLDCDLDGNLLGCSAEQGSNITFNGGLIQLGAEGVGLVAASSSARVFQTALVVKAGGQPGAFFVAERNANLNFQDHSVDLTVGLETGVNGGHVVVLAQMGSTVVCEPTWVSNGKCKIQTNSVLVRSIARSPWKGGVDKDTSSSEVANL
jgi:hypothetical protein